MGGCSSKIVFYGRKYLLYPRPSVSRIEKKAIKKLRKQLCAERD